MHVGWNTWPVFEMEARRFWPTAIGPYLSSERRFKSLLLSLFMGLFIPRGVQLFGVRTWRFAGLNQQDLAGNREQRDLGVGSRRRPGRYFRSSAEGSTLIHYSVKEHKRSELQGKKAFGARVGDDLSLALCRTDC